MTNQSATAKKDQEKVPPAGKEQDSKEVSGNMTLWDDVATPPEDALSKADFGRGFTSIDAYWQIKKATEHFGRIGIKWWYDVELVEKTDFDLILKISLHLPGADHPIIQFGSNRLTKKDQSHADADSWKIATTDGLTKCLSYAGFGADVFLGKFDDNKYANKDEKRTPEEKKVNIDELKKKDWVECPMCKNPLEYKEWEKAGKTFQKYECVNGCKDQNKPKFPYSIWAKDATLIPGTESSNANGSKPDRKPKPGGSSNSQDNPAHLKDFHKKLETAYNDLIDFGIDKDYLAGQIKSWNLNKNNLKDAVQLLNKFIETKKEYLKEKGA